ncbi:MAG: hypothetical protein CVT88_04035 [Candidatus Altiarchaeales archaeon HGW-Altiarchaeales-1]|nr:MAG: hypothetical protein CVT88_04035 [Candidatus Altiarchaeales archaeon HGW-Altiarchaeales-1]
MEKRWSSNKSLHVLSDFATFVKDNWMISINMRQHVLNGFLIAGKYKNIYEVKKEQREEIRKVRALEIPEEQAVKEHLKVYFKSRVTFDRTFKDGEKFKYGALNIGGMGPKKYGEYCVIFERKHSEKYSSLAFIKEDSINYVDDCKVNIEKLKQDLSNEEGVHFLVTLKHEGELGKIPTNEWASIICSDECYVEAVTKDDVVNDPIEGVRMSKKDYLYYYGDLLFKDYVSDADMSDFERCQLGAFMNMQEILTKRKIKLDVIDENEN